MFLLVNVLPRAGPLQRNVRGNQIKLAPKADEALMGGRGAFRRTEPEEGNNGTLSNGLPFLSSIKFNN